MKKYIIPLILVLLLTFALTGFCLGSPFATNGGSQPFYPTLVYPSAYYYNGNTYVVWQGTDLKPYIDCYIHSSGKWSGGVKVSDTHLTDDDHGTPAVIVDDNGYIHVFFGCHSTALKHSKSTNTEDINAWTAQTNIGTLVTYPNLVKINDGTLYLIAREGPGYHTCYRTSSNWTSVNEIIGCDEILDRIYHGNIEYESTNGRIHISWDYLDYSDSSKRLNIYHAYLKLSDGKMYSMDGTDLGVTITKAEADTYCKIVDSGAYQTNVPALHLDSNNYPYVIYNIDTATGWEHKFIYWSGSAWEDTVKITDSGHQHNYSDFIINGSNDIDAYLITSSTSARSGDIEKWHWNGTDWSKTSTILQKTDVAYDGLNMPKVVVDGVSGLQCVFCDTDPDVYTHYDLRIFAVDSSDNFVTSNLSWLSGYDHRIKFTIDHTKIDSDINWFPVTTFFTSTQAEEVFAEFDSDDDFDRGQFTKADGTGLLYGDCEIFDVSESKGIYFVSREGWGISSTVDADYYFYYDKVADHNTTYISKSGGTAAQSVWDSNIKAVYHMADASTPVLDSTSNNNDGTEIGTPTYQQAGQVNGAVYFDGTGEGFNCGNGASLKPAGNFTLSLCAKTDDYTMSLNGGVAYGDLFGSFGGLSYSISFHAGDARFQIANASAVFTQTVAIEDNNWHLYTLVFDGTYIRGYKDGAAVEPLASSAPTYKVSYDYFTISSRPAGEYDITGLMDEISLAGTNRSAAWIKAEYNSLWDTLLTYGSKEFAGIIWNGIVITKWNGIPITIPLNTQ